MENKKISNLVVPMTKKSLSLLGAVTIMATSLSGCKGEVKNNSSSDISMTSSVTSEDEVLESSIYEETISSDLESSSEVIDDTSKDNSEITSNNSSKVNSGSGNRVTSSNDASSNKNNQTNNSTTNNQINNSTNSNQSSSSVVSTPSNTKPTMPSKLTKDNINDVACIDAFATRAKSYMYTVNGEYLYTVIEYQHEGKKYECGKDEFRFLISILNDGYINQETLNEMFGDKTSEEIERYSRILGIITKFIVDKNAIMHYDLFVVDQKLLNFLNEFESQLKKYIQNNNKDEFNKYINSFYNKTNKYINYQENKVIDCYVYFLISNVSTIHNNQELELLSWMHVLDSSGYEDYLDEFSEKVKSKQYVKN